MTTTRTAATNMAQLPEKRPTSVEPANDGERGQRKTPRSPRRLRPILLAEVAAVLLGLVLLLLSVTWIRVQRPVRPVLHALKASTLSVRSSQAGESNTLTASAPAASPTVLDCLQVAQPVLAPDGAQYQSTAGDGSDKTVTIPGSSTHESCSVLLMDYIFADSYNEPFVGNYTPPSCEFNRVLMNFTVVSEGRQFDRLALMYFGDTEVWRTSTAEPTKHPGIRWTYLKDMTQFLYFWKSPQTVIFDLGNLINENYTGSFNTTLTATFFTSDVDTSTAPAADLIIPISTRNSSAEVGSAFVVPKENATNTIGFPRNVNRAVFSVSACGQADEEFWWANVLQSDVKTFNKSTGDLFGYSPWREVQFLIDGQVVGVQWPYPVIFTGGVAPSLHRPIVGIDSFDLREHEIDITPFLPLLCDGAQHTFSILVAGLNDTGHGGANSNVTEAVNHNWVVSGKIFVWLDANASSITTGTPPSVDFGRLAVALSQSVTKNATGFNETLTFDVAVSRSVSVKATVRSQQGGSRDVGWSQSLSYANAARLTAFGATQTNELLIQGTDVATDGSASGYYRTTYGYPLYCNQSETTDAQGNITLLVNLTQGLSLYVEGRAVFPDGLEAFVGDGDGGGFAASLVNTTQTGRASFVVSANGKSSKGVGSTSQVFRFGGVTAVSSAASASASGASDTPDPEDVVPLFFREVAAFNNTLVSDTVTLGGGGNSTESWTPPPPPNNNNAAANAAPAADYEQQQEQVRLFAEPRNAHHHHRITDP